MKTEGTDMADFSATDELADTQEERPAESVRLSGTVPEKLEYIPDGYTSPSEHPGTLEKITYQTWESFTYDSHEQELTKEAWVYLPYGYSEDQ